MRNYLAHEFFVENAVRSLSKNGQKQLIDELSQMLSRLMAIDKEFDLLWKSEWSNHGITQEFLDKEFKKMETEASHI